MSYYKKNPWCVRHPEIKYVGIGHCQILHPVSKRQSEVLERGEPAFFRMPLSEPRGHHVLASEHDEPDKRMTMIISVKEHLHMLADKISSYFPHLPATHLHLPDAHSQSKLKMFLRQHKRSSLNLLTVMQRELISLQCQLQNSRSSVCNHILFCLRLCCAFFFHFQQHVL
uniref:Uncharacterized protein n=1 Tax=Molossus molossus TaxID=27622 RepID=A0A7J8DTE8_MOLMO|nr:hypothetical protein HJG59_009099 [Molossus molossus]